MTRAPRDPILVTTDDEVAIAGFGLASGWAHETPRLRGVTDRAMQCLAATPGVDASWRVEALVTYFWVRGSPRGVRIGLSDVLRQARRPVVLAPLTDTAASPDVDAQLLMLRWGLRGFGLQGWRRLGFASAGVDDVAEVLARIGTGTVQLFGVNADVDVAAVPDATAEPPAEPAFPPLVTPPVLFDAQGGFAMSWLVPSRDVVAEGLVRLAVAESAAAPYGTVGPGEPVGSWLSRRLGTQGSHTAVVVRTGLSDEATAHLAERLRRWTIDGPDEADLERAVSSSFDARPQSPWEVVRGAVEESLVGSEMDSWQDPTKEAATGSLAAILDSLLVCAPEVSTAVRLARPAAAPTPAPLAGKAYRPVRFLPRKERRGIVVTAGADGLAVRDSNSYRVIRREDVAVVERWPRGQVELSSVDGTSVSLDPAALIGGTRVAAYIRELAPDDVVEHTEARVPNPSLARACRQAGGWALTALVLLAPAVLLAALFLLGAVAGSGSSGDRIWFTVLGLVFAALAALAAMRASRLRLAVRALGLDAWGKAKR